MQNTTVVVLYGRMLSTHNMTMCFSVQWTPSAGWCQNRGILRDWRCHACVATAARLLPFSLKPIPVSAATISGSGCTAGGPAAVAAAGAAPAAAAPACGWASSCSKPRAHAALQFPRQTYSGYRYCP